MGRIDYVITSQLATFQLLVTAYSINQHDTIVDMEYLLYGHVAIVTVLCCNLFEVM